MKTKILICIVLAFTISISLLHSEDFDKSKLPKLLGASNAGTEFYITFLPCWESKNGSNAIKIYVSSSVATNVRVEVPGKGFVVEKMSIPNDVIEFTLEPEIAMPLRKTDRDIPEPERVFVQSALHITSESPIICYAVTRFSYTSDGYLALPVTSLGNEYIVASYADPAGQGSQYLSSYTSITAPYDQTKVDFTMGGTASSKTGGGLLPGETESFNLNSGDVFLIGGLGSHAELTGSKITSDKPVSVISGNFCAYVPTSCGCCDFLIEQELPTFSWGTEYHVTKINDRKKNSIIKIFAKEPMTMIYRDYKQIGLIREAGGTDSIGYLAMRADDGEPRPIVISGDKPISVTQYNTGQQDDNIMSDPFQMNLEPIEQYQNEITFCTPGIKGGFGFLKNYINLCYQATPEGEIPPDMQIAIVENGEFKWLSLKDYSPGAGISFAKGDESKNYFSKTIQLPEDGVYKIRALMPFVAYAYGFSSYDSYGFPTAGSFIESHDDKIPPKPVCEPSSNGLITGTVDCSDKQVQIIGNPSNDIKNSKLSFIMLYEPESFNYKLSTSSFVPGNDFTANWELNVIDKSKDAKAILIFADRSGNDTTLVFTYKPLSVEESNSDLALSLYPQPVKNDLSINYTLDNNEIISINIINTSGETVRNLVENELMIQGQNVLNYNLSDLQNGTYFIQIIKTSGNINRKFVVVK